MREKPGFYRFEKELSSVEPRELPEGSHKCYQLDKRMTADDSYILLYNQLLLVADIGDFVDHLSSKKSIKSVVLVGLFSRTSFLSFKTNRFPE